MSAAASPAPAASATDPIPTLGAGGQPRKSYRRKYRKIMVKFEERMRESTNLFKDEQRIFDISQRLAEQTDQMLQVLLEFNNRPQVPPRFRFDLRPSIAPKVNPRSDKHRDRQSAHEDLRIARNRIQKGEATDFEYEQLQEDILDSAEFAPSKSYATLINSVDLAELKPSWSDTDAPPAAGALTIRQEEQYLQGLDDFLDGKVPAIRPHATKSLGSRTAEKTADREREMQLRNPVSVYNWLRKHQPQVFLQDHEPSTGEKTTTKSSGSRSSKRMAGREYKQDQDYYDEDGIAVDQSNSSKGKRKRDDDTAFRPKGGRSGHPAKRRKEDGGGGGKKSKRSSLDARNA